MPQDIAVAVTRNIDLGDGNHLLEFIAPGMAHDMNPGQFFMIGIPGAEILLRRPFSVCGLPGTFEDAPHGSLQVLYRVLGRGTTQLASLQSGSRIQVLGPLGRGFDAPTDSAAVPLFVAGGIGSAPFPALAAALKRRGHGTQMLYGARTAADLPLLDWFRENVEEVTVTTDDGSLGRRGLVTAALEDRLREGGHGRFHVYACGPSPMLKAVARLALASGIRCDLSLEAPMACGFGVCLGCVVATRGEEPGTVRFERVCVEGPVMPAERLVW